MIRTVTTAMLLTCVTALAPAPALACGPDDCKDLNAEERARDRDEVLRLNGEQARYVQQRDAEYARGWDAQARHAQDQAEYEARKAEYERRLAAWREAVRRCEAGDWRACQYGN